MGEELSQGCMSGKWQSGDSNPDLWAMKAWSLEHSALLPFNAECSSPTTYLAPHCRQAEGSSGGFVPTQAHSQVTIQVVLCCPLGL